MEESYGRSSLIEQISHGEQRKNVLAKLKNILLNPTAAIHIFSTNYEKFENEEHQQPRLPNKRQATSNVSGIDYYLKDDSLMSQISTDFIIQSIKLCKECLSRTVEVASATEMSSL